MSSSSALTVIIEKLASKDKDFRYMATSDLLNELQKDYFRTDPDQEKRLCAMILTQLEDISGDISGLAVKCLGLLVRKVAEARAEDMIKSLADKIVAGKKEQYREIAGIGLKTIISEVQGGTLATATAKIVTAKMIEGAGMRDMPEIVNESLDILTDCIAKFGHLVVSEHSRIKECLLGHLDDQRPSFRKRVLHCLAATSVYLNEDLLSATIAHLLSQLQEEGSKGDIARTYIQAIAQISRAVGYRFGNHLNVALPLIVKYCESAAEGDDELREFSLQALESFVLKCPHDARVHLQLLLTTALTFLKYDPNFADDMVDEDGMDGEDDYDMDSDDAYSDDEDISWKVRRASAKVLSAIIIAYPDCLASTYRECGDALIQRFREREENVLHDVFAAFIDMCRQVRLVSKSLAADDPENPIHQLEADVPSVVRTTAKQLKDSKSLKTKVGVLNVMKELTAVLPASVSEHDMLIPGVVQALKEKSTSSSGVKIEALQYLRLAIGSQPSIFQPHVATLAPAIFAAANENYYKVAAEALRVCELMVKVMASPPLSADLQPLVTPMFTTIMQRLCAQDQDQEVKECAILAMASMVKDLATAMPAGELGGVLRVLLDRLRNETTRLPSVRAFAQVCNSSAPLDMSGVLDAVLMELTSFLRKANRALRQASLQTLEAVTTKYGSVLGTTSTSQCVEEAALLVTDADLSLASLSLKFFVALLKEQPAVGDSIAEKVLPHAMVLVRSPLLQRGSNTLEVLQVFFSQMSASGVPAASCEALLPQLLAVGGANDAASAKQAQHSVAQCVAVLCCAAGPAVVQDSVQKLLNSLKQDTSSPSQRLHLLCLGEIGRRIDLSSIPQVGEAVTSALTSDSEEAKAAASFALGGITCGNLSVLMPGLLQRVAEAGKSSSKLQYLLLHALNEVIASITAMRGEVAGMELAAGVKEQMLSMLLSNCDGEEECRNVVAECLGHVALLYPEEVMSALHERIKAPSAHTRSVVVSAIKYAVVEKPHPIDSYFQRSGILPDFLTMMSDEDRHVRRAAVVSLSALAHQKQILVAGHLTQLLPMLYAQTVMREDMIRTVDLGPFKHKIDDGLELRKAAFECLDILLDTCRSALSVDAGAFVSHLESGLKDHYDVKMPCHLMVSKLAGIEPAALLNHLEKLVEPLDKTLLTKLKSDAVKQEIDRHEDMLRSCLRAIDSLNRLQGSETCAPFQAFMKKTVMGAALKDKFLAVEKERMEAEGPSDIMDLS